MSQFAQSLASRSGIVRQSCDACGQSHVRCQPRQGDGQACVRCHEKRLNCNYSISRRGPPKLSQSSYTSPHDNGSLDFSKHNQELLEQYMPRQNSTSCLPQSPNGAQDPMASPAVSLEQWIAWSMPSLSATDSDQTTKMDTSSWEPPGLQEASTGVSSTESEPSPMLAGRSWSFDLTGQKRNPSQALCPLCSERSDRLSRHASHSFWPLATQSSQTLEPAMSIGMDELLDINKDTIESIRGILDCTCSENTLLFEKCSTSVGRVIDWYAGAFLGHNMVIAATVRIGSYVVGPAESRNQTSAVVLAEMHNLLLPLLDQLGAVYQKHKSMNDGWGQGLGDPKCHWSKVNSFFCSVRQSAQTSL